MTTGLDQTAAALDLPIRIDRIMEMIPHRYPLLLIDRIVELTPGESAVAIKNVTMNEPQFQGHFPGHPVMPGVLQVEAMAQTAAALVEAEGKLVYFMTIENARFRKPVTPGDQLRVEVVKERNRGNVWKFKGQCMLDGKVASEASFSAMIVDR
jgi:3-hydroxyacyl-[acyl-carrier-protein] dehydratase